MLKSNKTIGESIVYEAPSCALLSIDENAVLCDSQDAIGSAGEFEEQVW